MPQRVSAAHISLFPEATLHFVCLVVTTVLHRAGWRSGKLPDLYSGSTRFRILAGTPAILTQVFRGFPQSIQTNVPIGRRCFQIIPSSYAVLPFGAT
jgi:hypothetical protein